MAKITDRSFEETGHTAFICDFSPPRSGDVAAASQADIDSDFISVAYNPGRAVRTNSAMLAAAVRQQTGKDAVFTLATRDMNKLAMQSLLLGAQVMGLENLVVVQGDPFSPRDLVSVSAVDDYRPTGLIAAVAKMNEGRDFRGSQLRSSTDFCVGATADLGRGTKEEAALAVRKVRAGAHFLMTQPIFSASQAGSFRESFTAQAGETKAVPVFFGLQILEADGMLFSSVPEEVRSQLEGGRPGVELALELYSEFQEAGLHDVYLVPPIRRGGARNYDAAREFLAQANRL